MFPRIVVGCFLVFFKVIPQSQSKSMEIDTLFYSLSLFPWQYLPKKLPSHSHSVQVKRFFLQTSFSSSFSYSLCIPLPGQTRCFSSVLSALQRGSPGLWRRRIPSDLHIMWHGHCLFYNSYKWGAMKENGKQPAEKLSLALRELQTRSVMALLLQQSVFSLNLCSDTTCI